MVVMLIFFSSESNAVGREDELECGLPDGGKFILGSKYDWSLIPLPMVHSSRETNRGSWGAAYLEPSEKVVIVPASVHYSGKSSLKNVCVHFGSKNGVPLAPFSFRQADHSWYHCSTVRSGGLKAGFNLVWDDIR